MTNEITKVELTNSTGFPRRFTVAPGIAITKGSLLALSDPRTASQAATVGAVCAGIAAMDKSATDDTSTSISVWTDFIGDAVASGAIPIGYPVRSTSDANYPNTVGLAPATASGAAVIGYTLEAASDAERINVRFKF